MSTPAQQLAIFQLYQAYENPNLRGTFEPELLQMKEWTLYPWTFVMYLSFLFTASKVFEAALERWSEKYRELHISKQKIVVTYFMEIVTTSIIFILQMYYGLHILKDDPNITFTEVKGVRICGYMLAGLYMWELVYRLDMGKPLMAHHVLTLALMQIAFACIADYPRIVIVRLQLVVLLSATTEQLSFVALLLFRFKFLANATAALFGAGVQSFVVKTTIYIYTWVVWADYVAHFREGAPADWDRFVTFVVPFLFFFLYLTQLISVKIFFVLGARTMRSLAKIKGVSSPRTQKMMKLLHIQGTTANLGTSSSPHGLAADPKDEDYTRIMSDAIVPGSSSSPIPLSVFPHDTVQVQVADQSPPSRVATSQRARSDQATAARSPSAALKQALLSFANDPEWRTEWKKKAARPASARFQRSITSLPLTHSSVAARATSTPVAAAPLPSTSPRLSPLSNQVQRSATSASPRGTAGTAPLQPLSEVAIDVSSRTPAMSVVREDGEQDRERERTLSGSQRERSPSLTPTASMQVHNTGFDF